MSVRDKIVLLSALIVIVGGALIINGRFNAKFIGIDTSTSPAVNQPNSRTKELTIKDTDAFKDARVAVSVIKDINEPAVVVTPPQATEPQTPVVAAQDTKPNPVAAEADAAVRATAQLPKASAAVTVAAAAPTSAAEPVVTGNTYVVQKGQTLIDIALAVYKDKSNAIANARKIYEYNKDQMPSIDKLKIGQKLRLPAIENPKLPQSKVKQFADNMQDKVSPEKIQFMSSTFVAAPKETAKEAAKQGKAYTVKKGDNLWTISQKVLGSGARYKEIVAANQGMLDKNPKLSPGMTIVIPN